jgi:hypothetical protein
MKLCNLLISPLLSVLLTGFVLTHAGWLPTKQAARPVVRHGEARAHARDNDLFASDAGRRWRNCEPTHWRGYMLQR